MSVTTTLRPDTSDDSGGDLDPNLSTGWHDMSDDSDVSWVGAQLSPSEPSKHLEGSWSNLPVGVGRVNTCTVRARAAATVIFSAGLTVFTDSTGVGTGVARISVATLADVITNYSSAPFSTYTTKPLVDALRWGLFTSFVANPGVDGRIYELYLDVDWDPGIAGLKGLIFSVLGPLVAVGLHELPRLAREVHRRAATRIPPGMYLQAWQELREDRGRRYFPLCSVTSRCALPR